MSPKAPVLKAWFPVCGTTRRWWNFRSGTLWKEVTSLGTYPGEDVGMPAPTFLSLLPNHHEASSFLHHVLPHIICSLTTGPKQRSQLVITETSETISQNKPFILFKLHILVFCHSGPKLTHTSYSFTINSLFFEYHWHKYTHKTPLFLDSIHMASFNKPTYSSSPRPGHKR